jgi:hypothetical protein
MVMSNCCESAAAECSVGQQVCLPSVLQCLHSHAKKPSGELLSPAAGSEVHSNSESTYNASVLSAADFATTGRSSYADVSTATHHLNIHEEQSLHSLAAMQTQQYASHSDCLPFPEARNPSVLSSPITDATYPGSTETTSADDEPCAQLQSEMMVSSITSTRKSRSMPLLRPIRPPPQSSDSLSTAQKRYLEDPDSPSEPPTPRPRPTRHIWKPPKLPVPRVPSACGPAAAACSNPTLGQQQLSTLNNTLSAACAESCSTAVQSDPASVSVPCALTPRSHNFHSNTAPLMHRVISAGSCASSSYAASCATVTPYAWLPCDADRSNGRSSRLSNATSSATISTLPEASDTPTRQRQSPRSAADAPSVSLDTLTLSPTPLQLLACTSVHTECALSNQLHEASHTLPVTAAVTSRQCTGSAFHFPGPDSSNEIPASAHNAEMLSEYPACSESGSAIADSAGVGSEAETTRSCDPGVGDMRCHCHYTFSGSINPGTVTTPSSMITAKHPLSHATGVPYADHPAVTSWGFMGTPFCSNDDDHVQELSLVAVSRSTNSHSASDFPEADAPWMVHSVHDTLVPSTLPSDCGSPRALPVPAFSQYPQHIDSPKLAAQARIPTLLPRSKICYTCIPSS